VWEEIAQISIIVQNYMSFR